jgi:hypothetical protein
MQAALVWIPHTEFVRASGGENSGGENSGGENARG